MSGSLNARDVTRHRDSGHVCTTSNDKPMIWNGHLCEGANLVGGYRNVEFCLWTRCGSKDVPANAAHEGSFSEVTCEKCAALSRAGGQNV